MSKFHEDWEKNVSTRLFTCCHYIHIKKTATLPGGPYIHITNAKHVTSREKDTPPPGGHIEQTRKKNAPPLGSHVFKPSKFHEDRKINVAFRVLTRKNAPPLGGHVFQPTNIIFKLFQDIIMMNLLTKFHEDRTINVASRVKNAPPLGSHVFQANVTIFELIQDIIETNLLTKFHEDWK
ncbi:hypothetical protein DPMN_095501 [Dreissena polymorpha]|uniref:Uncharacterized protein n=1 Tax=Dreissena polymorpha TaxID=45954 RepID=A0A9D4L826_DREPO|nr:hypothetical protein DPMN_095501 [Dreissena polymorpha]